MKKIPIKFRGRFWLKGLDPSDINTRLSDGDFVFGGYARMKFLFDDDDGDYIIQNDSTAFLVYPNSVAQLVGYDADGDEVYTGDKLYFYRCFCLSGADIRAKNLKPAGVCRVIDAHCLAGLHGVGLNYDIDYSFLLKAKLKVEKMVGE